MSKKKEVEKSQAEIYADECAKIYGEKHPKTLDALEYVKQLKELKK